MVDCFELRLGSGPLSAQGTTLSRGLGAVHIAHREGIRQKRPPSGTLISINENTARFGVLHCPGGDLSHLTKNSGSCSSTSFINGFIYQKIRILPHYTALHRTIPHYATLHCTSPSRLLPVEMPPAACTPIQVSMSTQATSLSPATVWYSLV